MSTSEGYKDSESLTKWVRFLLYVQILVGVISIVSGYLEYELLINYQSGIYKSQALAVADGVASDKRQFVVGVIYIVVFAVPAFLILKWLYRANYNARQLGARDMKFTPGWSIGYYFIPILTLWKPYQAMKELWKASKNPSDFSSETSSVILPIWWALWLLSGILGQMIYRRTGRTEGLTELIDLNLITQVSNLLEMSLALVFLAVVNHVYKMQIKQLEGMQKV